MKPSSVKNAASEADAQIIRMQNVRDGLNEDGTPIETPDTPADLSLVPPSDPAPDVTPADLAPGDVDSQLAALRKDLETMTARWSSQDGILRTQADQIKMYQGLLANMTPNKQTDPDLQPTPPEPAAPMYSQAQVEVFGEDMAEFVMELSRKVVRHEISGMSANMEGLKKTVESTSAHVAVSANDSFERKLDELSPGWAKLDEDEAFMVWLKERPVFGNAIATASQNLDAGAAAEIFNTYSSLMGIEPPAPAPAPTPVDDRQAELNEQVAPGKARHHPTPARDIPEEKTWLLSEITAVYKAHQSRNGKPQYSAEEFAAVEIEIAAAQRDGRVDYNQ